MPAYERVKGACMTHILNVFSIVNAHNAQNLASGGPPGSPDGGTHHGPEA